MSGSRIVASPILWVGLFFAVLVLRMEALRPVFQWAFPGVEPVIYQRSSFLALFLSHFALVAAASLAAISVGLSLAVFVTRPVGQDFRLMVNTLATVGQTLPKPQRAARSGRRCSHCFSMASCRSSRARLPGWKECLARCAKQPRGWVFRIG